ncbi:MAG: MDR family oxidoreductase [Burkholderiales bacterium]
MNTPEKFQAIVVRQDDDKKLSSKIEMLSIDQLPEGDVLVRVMYSSLNFKDAAGMANRGIYKKFPIVPGIDLAGVVEQSNDPRHQPGDEVILTGWGVGEQYWGGMSQYARVSGDWLVAKPEKLSLRDCMAIGTAGLTAMLSVLELEQQGLVPGDREVLVTGAAGGLGSMAVTLLARKGYRVAALTGRPETDPYLRALGAATIVPREELSVAKRPGRMTMEKESYAGAIDVVGGNVLSAILPQLSYGATVAVCGLAGGTDLDTTVFPFILRAIPMSGIDSVRCPVPRRAQAWKAISELLTNAEIEGMSTEITLDQVFDTCPRLLACEVRGRCVVRLWE